ncbi:MAG TPA: hypothetical protein VEB86_08460 [Chryseosolibacter sp.]|nr:hypothetical protein [Chryseosolibacter sp.]
MPPHDGIIPNGGFTMFTGLLHSLFQVGVCDNVVSTGNYSCSEKAYSYQTDASSYQNREFAACRAAYIYVYKRRRTFMLNRKPFNN